MAWLHWQYTEGEARGGSVHQRCTHVHPSVIPCASHLVRTSSPVAFTNRVARDHVGLHVKSRCKTVVQPSVRVCGA